MVGIGASAGGLEALVELLGALPPTGMAFIVVQHLDPTHESLLSEILAKKTALPVSLAIAGETLEADHVYVIPADAILSVHDGRIELKRRTNSPERPLPVNVLFSSLAAVYADRAIGVVLSGGDSDGAFGICEIKHAGGFTFAQRPESARFPSMPLHAIETGCVDQVLRPARLPRSRVSAVGSEQWMRSLKSERRANGRSAPKTSAGDWRPFSSEFAWLTVWISRTTSEPRLRDASSGA